MLDFGTGQCLLLAQVASWPRTTCGRTHRRVVIAGSQRQSKRATVSLLRSPARLPAARPSANQSEHQIDAEFVAESSDGKEVGLDEQLREAVLEGGGAPDRFQTPAAVWLPSEERVTTVDNQNRKRDVVKRLASLASRGQRIVSSWVLYQIQQRLMLGTLPTKVLGYFLLGSPAVVLNAVLYRQASGRSLGQSLVQSFGNLYHFPGATVLNDVSIPATALNILLYFLGTLTFALILGVITEDLSSRYQRIRQGSYPVAASKHTLVLGWSRLVVPLLRQIETAQETREAMRGPVVILAAMPKPEMDADLAAALPHTKLDIATRPGDPGSTLAVNRAGGARASRVIVLCPDGISMDGIEDVNAEGMPHTSLRASQRHQVAALLALQTVRLTALRELHGDHTNGLFHPSNRGRRHREWFATTTQSIVVQTPAPVFSDQRSSTQSTTAESASSVRLHTMVGLLKESAQNAKQSLELDELDLAGGLSALLARSASQPGIASVMASLLQQTKRGAWIRVVDLDSKLVDLTYGEVRRRILGGIMLGLLAPSSQRIIKLNPPDDECIEPGSGLVVLARGSGSLKIADSDLRTIKAPPLIRSKGDAIDKSSTDQDRAKHAYQSTNGAKKAIIVLDSGLACGESPSHKLCALIEQLKAASPPGSAVTVLGPCPIPGLDKESSTCTSEDDSLVSQSVSTAEPDAEANEGRQLSDESINEGVECSPDQPYSSSDDMTLSYIHGHPSDIDKLKQAGVADADAVVFLGQEGSIPESSGLEADSELVSMLMLLETVVKSARTKPHPLHALSTLHRPETVQVANHILSQLCYGHMTAELLQPDELAAGVLTQVAAEPRLGPLLNRLIAGGHPDGATIRPVSPQELGIGLWADVRFGEVQECVRERCQTALGLITREGKMTLAPTASELWRYHRDDRIIVLE